MIQILPQSITTMAEFSFQGETNERNRRAFTVDTMFLKHAPQWFIYHTIHQLEWISTEQRLIWRDRRDPYPTSGTTRHTAPTQLWWLIHTPPKRHQDRLIKCQELWQTGRWQTGKRSLDGRKCTSFSSSFLSQKQWREEGCNCRQAALLNSVSLEAAALGAVP